MSGSEKSIVLEMDLDDRNKCMWNMAIGKKLADVTIACRNGNVHAHSIILCSVLKNFRSVFTNCGGQSNSFFSDATGFDTDVVRLVLKYLYLGGVEVPDTMSRDFNMCFFHLNGGGSTNW